MRRLMSLRSNVVTAMFYVLRSPERAYAVAAHASRGNDRGRRAAVQYAGDRARGVNAADDDFELALAGQGKGGRVHDLQIARDRFVMGEAVIAHGLGIGFRIGRIDAIHLRRLEKDWKRV